MKARKMGLPIDEEQEEFKDTEPNFYMRKFLDARI